MHIWVAGTYFPDGQYSFPFSFILPDNLAPTFYTSWPEHSLTAFGKISYKIRTGFRKENSNKMVFLDRVINVVSQKPKGSSQLTAFPFNRPVSAYCSSHGNYFLKIEISENSLSIGQIAELLISVGTQKAETALRKIDCILEMTTHISARSRHHKRISKQKTITLPGIPTGILKIGKDALHVKMEITTFSMLTGSVQGKNIQNSFLLKARGEIDGIVCCDKNPFSQVPVFVTCKHVSEISNQELPENWNPKKFDAVSCDFNQNTRTTQEFRKSILGDLELPKVVNNEIDLEKLNNQDKQVKTTNQNNINV